jgi:hypothetical protein
MTEGSKGQMTVPIQFFRELDRNFHGKGGRSFYFFDLDDNVLHLPSELVLFKESDSSIKSVSTEDWIEFKEHMNNPSPSLV